MAIRSVHVAIAPVPDGKRSEHRAANRIDSFKSTQTFHSGATLERMKTVVSLKLNAVGTPQGQEVRVNRFLRGWLHGGLHCAVLAVLFITLTNGQHAFAQGMSVFTKVVDITNPEQPIPQSHSLTLFHGGRVYDYMEEAGEVVIFEPIHHRFIVLGSDFAATEVSFAEINHFLETAQTKALQYIEELSIDSDPKSASMAAAIRFQLSPSFDVSYDEANRKLQLSGTELQYDVIGQAVESEAAVHRYLEYADWAKRLNYVLHSQPSLPQPRLKLNERLREHSLLPLSVELTLHLDPPVRFRAEHRYADELKSNDRRLISLWEQRLQSDKVRWMTFRQYQQNLLAQSQP